MACATGCVSAERLGGVDVLGFAAPVGDWVVEGDALVLTAGCDRRFATVPDAVRQCRELSRLSAYPGQRLRAALSARRRRARRAGSWSDERGRGDRGGAGLARHALSASGGDAAAPGAIASGWCAGCGGRFTAVSRRRCRPIAPTGGTRGTRRSCWSWRSAGWCRRRGWRRGGWCCSASGRRRRRGIAGSSCPTTRFVHAQERLGVVEANLTEGWLGAWRGCLGFRGIIARGCAPHPSRAARDPPSPRRGEDALWRDRGTVLLPVGEKVARSAG